MKKITPLLFACFLVTSLFGQSAFNIGSFTIKKFEFGYGYEQDMINNMGYSYFVNQLPDIDKQLLSNFDFAPEHYYAGICENPSLNFGFVLTHPALKNFEWQNRFLYKKNRVDAVSYRNHSDWDGDYMTFNGRHSEFGLESALLYKVSLANTFNFYGGAGTNLGFTTGNEICYFTSHDLTALDIDFRNSDNVNIAAMQNEYGEFSNCVNTSTQVTQRLFLQAGFGLELFRKIELGVDVKYGVGYRAAPGKSITGTNYTSSNLSIRYILD